MPKVKLNRGRYSTYGELKVVCPDCKREHEIWFTVDEVYETRYDCN